MGEGDIVFHNLRSPLRGDVLPRIEQLHSERFEPVQSTSNSTTRAAADASFNIFSDPH